MSPLRSQVSFALRFIKVRMVYRAAFWIDFLFDTLIVFMQVFVWRTLLGVGTETVVTIPEMTTYVTLSRAIRGLTRTRADTIIEDRL